ncbi:expressed unknown protein [Seminavis robusta]|uniref:Uncharacterized protein n=1 Tax=Seminavis robusta TaxID=568900 RepID=A0A9N8DTU1_9STRA|nr:expressed unknown protein [Seminavis robusta]|eukprot:Sro366_g127540.1 n/a (186) ;mRNA; f:7797-8354
MIASTNFSTILVVFSLLAIAANGFLSCPNNAAGCARRSQQLYQSKKTSSDFKQEEISEMEDLILSLSQEPTDESRRGRLQTMFDKELAKPNGAPQHFADLFDCTLVMVGDRVKTEAQQVAEKLQEEAEAAKGDGDDDDEEAKPPELPESFKKQQQQVWALVDMMIQSKTIVKKATGTLGSKGTFQ